MDVTLSGSTPCAIITSSRGSREIPFTIAGILYSLDRLHHDRPSVRSKAPGFLPFEALFHLSLYALKVVTQEGGFKSEGYTYKQNGQVRLKHFKEEPLSRE